MASTDKLLYVSLVLTEALRSEVGLLGDRVVLCPAFLFLLIVFLMLFVSVNIIEHIEGLGNTCIFTVEEVVFLEVKISTCTGQCT